MKTTEDTYNAIATTMDKYSGRIYNPIIGRAMEVYGDEKVEEALKLLNQFQRLSDSISTTG